MPTLLIATHNPGKRVEIAEILTSLPARLALLSDYGITVEVDETGHTYAENAALKAEAYFSASHQVTPGGLLTLADDSGLEVAALDGLPGIRSARFSPLPGATDADRRAHLLERLQGVPFDAGGGWRAVFHASVALVGPQTPLQLFSGQCQGMIIPEERGSGGFGYDPLFCFPAYGRTMAELGREIKNQISHRARALQAARPAIEEALRA